MARQLVLVLLLACVLSTPAPVAEATPLEVGGPAVKTGALESAALIETSGLAASRRNPGVLWAHNDSGDSARVFALAPTGKHLGIYSIEGVVAVDWEDIAIGPGPSKEGSWIYAGDIGDNFALRSTIVVYRFPEPVVSMEQPPVAARVDNVQALRLRYEDGARDAETLMVDSRTGDLYIVTKRESRSRVYRAAADDLKPGRTIELKLTGELSWTGATGGDISHDGSRIVIRGYKNVRMWDRSQSQTVAEALKGEGVEAPWVQEPQGEAICFAADGAGYYTVSEGRDSPIYYFPIEKSRGRGSAPGSK